MGWIKLNECVDYWEKPCLGSVEGKEPIMALTVDSKSKNPYFGLARRIIKREGSPDVSGFVDRSKLVIVSSDDLLTWKVEGDLEVKNIEKVVEKNREKYEDFIGLEDPDILTDAQNVKHVFFTIAMKRKKEYIFNVHLGHAFGASLKNLEATPPVLSPSHLRGSYGFKELMMPPLEMDSKFCLVEIENRLEDRSYSAVALIERDGLDSKWKFLKLVIDPELLSADWYAGDASPARFVFTNYLHEGKYLVGIFNGREKSQIVDGVEKYGKFRPGLFLFDAKTGEIPWISPEPLIEDSDATGITFASDFIQISDSEGILYAHVNDSFVRAYKLNIEKIKEMLPEF